MAETMALGLGIGVVISSAMGNISEGIRDDNSDASSTGCRSRSNRSADIIMMDMEDYALTTRSALPAGPNLTSQKCSATSQLPFYKTSKAKYRQASVGNDCERGTAKTILSLPDEVLMGILRAVSSAKGDLVFATVCSKFASLVQESVASVSVGPTRLLSESSFLQALAPLPNLTALSLARESLDRTSDALFRHVASKASSLRQLHLVFSRDCSASPLSLSSTLASCTLLRSLSLEGWSRGCIPDLFLALPTLEHLALELPCNVLPESIGLLPRLTSLKVSRRYGRNIRIPESLTALRRIQELSIECWDLSGAQEGISSLSSLSSLHLALRFPYQLPWSLEGLFKLTRLSLNCRYLEVLPEGLALLANLDMLSLACPFLRSLPPSMAQLQRLRALEVSVRGCLRIPADLWRLSQLEEIKIKCRHLVPSSPTWGFTQLPRLQSLSVKCAAVAPGPDHAALQGLQSIFSEDLGHLRSTLVNLNLRSERMERLPESLGQLQHLRRLTIGADEGDYSWEPMLKLRSRECLRSLPLSLASIGSLEELHIIKCSRLACLPPNLHLLTRLRSIFVRDCPFLEGMPAAIGSLSALEELDIDSCGTKRFRFILPDCFEHLTGLRKVKVCSNKLRIFPASLLCLPHLSALTIGCAAPEIPDAFSPNCSQLRELMFSGCLRLRELPKSLGCLQNLEELGIRECKALRRLPETLGQLRGLKKLQVVQCPATHFPDCFASLSHLEDLYINLRLKGLPGSFSSLLSLRNLHLRGFGLKVLPEVLRHLRGLQSLTVCGWSKLEAVPESVIELVSLRKLMICCCPRLRSLPRSILQMPNLSRGCRELLALEFDLPWLQPDDIELTHNCDWLQ